MATPRVLRFDAEGRSLKFSVWLLRARRLLESQVQAHETLWAHASGDLPEPAGPAPLVADSTPADSDRYAREHADVTAWKSRDAAACIALSSLLPESEEIHFTQVRTASEFLTAIKARYATPTTVSLGRMFLPFLFPGLASFERTADLITHLRSLDSSYRATCTDAQLALLPPPMAITIYFIATSLPGRLASVRDALLLKHPSELTIEVLESALKDVESNLRSVASASCDVPPSPPSPPVSGPPLPPPNPSLSAFPPPLPSLSPPLSHAWPSRRSPRACSSSPVPFTDLRTSLFRSSPPRSSPSVLPSPPELALTASLSTLVTDYYRMYRPVLSHILASLVTDPRASMSSVSTLTAAVTEFASTRCLDYATGLVAAPPTSPLAVGGESALGCDALEDRQFELEFLAAASPHLCAMLLAPEGDPDALDIPTPRTYAEAVSGPWASQWRAAMDSELASYRSTGTYVDKVPPPGANVVDGMWIFRVKRPPGSPPVFKARYVARGFSQREGVEFFHTFAPTQKMTTLRVLLHVAVQRDYELHSLDFSTAFLQGSLHEEVWLRRPSAFIGTFPPGIQWRLRRPVYGLHQAPREWHDTRRSTLSGLGFQPSSADPSVFVCRGSTPFFVLVYVDDLVFATADRVALVDVKLKLQKRHTCTDLGELRHYLGLQITKDRAARTITLSQSHMVQQVLQRFELQHSTVQRTPLAVDHRLTGPFPDESFEPSGPYSELVGCIMYLMTCTRPDLAFPLSILARFVAPGRHRPVHWTAAVRVAKYLATTSGVGLVLGGRQDVVLTGHCDSSFADDAKTHRSTQGYCFSLGSGAISWRSTRSSSVSTSTAEAEIYAGDMSTQELRWLTFLLTHLSERPSFAPTLFTDNKATILLCREPRLESRVKHINFRYFLLRELQRRGQARFDFVESEANTADIFTKALSPCDHQRCCVQLGLVNTGSRLA
ncbi:unnamed protein product [Closterium sp. NIES-53]